MYIYSFRWSWGFGGSLGDEAVPDSWVVGFRLSDPSWLCDRGRDGGRIAYWLAFKPIYSSPLDLSSASLGSFDYDPFSFDGSGFPFFAHFMIFTTR